MDFSRVKVWQRVILCHFPPTEYFFPRCVHSFNVSNQLLIPLISHFPKVLSERGGKFWLSLVNYKWFFFNEWIFCSWFEYFVYAIVPLSSLLNWCIFSPNSYLPHNGMLSNAPRSFRILTLFPNPFLTFSCVVIRCPFSSFRFFHSVPCLFHWLFLKSGKR